MKDYQETETVIGGRKANIRSYYTEESGRKVYVAELYIGEWAAGKVEMFMTWEGGTVADFAIARRVFNSIEFRKQ
jgi:hypothetical protein